MSTSAYIKKNVFPQVFVKPQLDQMNVNQRLYYSNKVLKHIEKQKEKNGALEKAQEELFCEFNDLSLKNKRLMSDFCQHVAKQTNFTDWITQQVKEQATLHAELVDKQKTHSQDIQSISHNVSSLSSTQTNHTNQLTNQKLELGKIKEDVSKIDELQSTYSKQLSEFNHETDLLKDQVLRQGKDNESLLQEQENLNRLLSTQQKQIDTHYHELSNQLDEHKKVHDELNQKLASQDEMNNDVEQQYNKLNDQFLAQIKINEDVTSSIHDHEQKMINFSDRLSQQEALYQLLHVKLMDVDEQHNHLYQQLNEHETTISKLDEHLLNHDHVHKDLYEELFFQKEELLYQVKKYEDMYNELHNNMKKRIKALKRHIAKTVAMNFAMFNSSTDQQTQYELPTSTNEDDKKYGELIQKLNDQVKVNIDLKRELSNTNYKGPFVELFKGLPSNFPIDSILINGKNVDVTRFLNISSEGSIAHFTDELQVKTFDCNKIDGVNWGKETLETKPNDYN
ncbi:hypothetical protein [Bacillus sp. AFS040349]|uniref:hypothetical protein n=1 Tax=Bacillus sp. AFS040349 TaxID=2033502 RepID=UPI000BFC2FAF|nr:hypothetical protein [Bacillus sp. AFS040349]PGT81057.1 hypothetical protein COD11_18950 [Bacillus sp. AFS040349]